MHRRCRKRNLSKQRGLSVVFFRFLKLCISRKAHLKTQVPFLRVSLRRGSRQVRFSTKSHSWLSILSILESRKRKGEKEQEMKSMVEFVLPEAKETPPLEELEVSKQQSSSNLEEVMIDRSDNDVMSDCDCSPVPRYSFNSDYEQIETDSPEWPTPVTPSFDWNANCRTEWDISSSSSTPEVSLTEEEESNTVTETTQPKTPLAPIVRSTANWQGVAENLVRNSMLTEKYLDIFCEPPSDSNSNLTFPGILDKLQNNLFATKSSFEFAINEIAEITQQNAIEESECWWKSEYLRLFFRIHWDAVFNYKYTNDELSVMNWKLNKIHRKLQPDEKPLWTFSPERL